MVADLTTVLPTLKSIYFLSGVRVSQGCGGRNLHHQLLRRRLPSVVDISTMKWRSYLHVRYMVGGRPSHPLQERLYTAFEFPESPGALSIPAYAWHTGIFRYSITVATVPIMACAGGVWVASPGGFRNRSAGAGL